MKKKYIILITITMLFLPIIAISFVWLIFKCFVFDNPDFWYGYMAYFGTIVLAAVALWQNENANMINQRLADMSCKDKIAYIVPLKSQIIRKNILEFRFQKRGNSFGFFVSYSLYIDGIMVSYKSLNDFYEETNTDTIYDKNIDLSEYNISENPQITLVINWQNQYGYRYLENIKFNFNKSVIKEDHLISNCNTFEIEYIGN